MASCLSTEKVQAAWRTLIASGRPTNFFTLTTRLPTSPETLERLVCHWLNRANRGLCGRHWFRIGQKGMRVAWIVELGTLGRAHAHVLLAHPDRVLNPRDVAWLEAIWSGKGRVDHRPVHDVEGIAQYLVKTIPTGGSPILSHRYWSRS